VIIIIIIIIIIAIIIIIIIIIFGPESMGLLLTRHSAQAAEKEKKPRLTQGLQFHHFIHRNARDSTTVADRTWSSVY
jgi:uncharacterized protein YpmB